MTVPSRSCTRARVVGSGRPGSPRSERDAAGDRRGAQPHDDEQRQAIEETGAAQHWRDSRITTIYEGTTGIQANDLIFRKLMRDGGATARYVFGEVAATAKALGATDTTI